MGVTSKESVFVAGDVTGKDDNECSDAIEIVSDWGDDEALAGGMACQQKTFIPP